MNSLPFLLLNIVTQLFNLKNLKYFSVVFLLAIFTIPATLVAKGSDHRLDPERSIVVGVNKNFAPYEYLNSSGKPDGYTVDLFKAVAEVLGVKVSFVVGDWHNIREKLATKQIDVVTGMLYSKERDKVFDFSIPHSIISYSLFVRKGSPIRALDDLKRKEVIVVDNVYAHDWLKEKMEEVSLVPVDAPDSGIELLSSGEHECLILPRLHGLNLVQDLQAQNVEIIGPPILEQKFSFAVSNGQADILADINDALFELQMSGKYNDIYLKWFSVEENNKSLNKIVRYALTLFIALCIVLFLIVWWNWNLKRTVNRVTLGIERSRKRLQQIVEGVAVPTFVVDCEGVVTHWNKACEMLTGRTADLVIGTKDYGQLLYPNQSKSTGELLLSNQLYEDTHQLYGVTYRKSRFLNEAYETELFFSNQGIEGQWFYVSAAILRDSSGKKLGVIESRQDLTEVKLLERQLIQSQKMEALGTLAGGIAHDFNNILLSIIGTVELAIRKHGNDPGLKEYLDIILSGGLRGKELTNKILAFSSKAENEPQRVVVATVVEETLALLTVTCAHNIRIIVNTNSDKAIIADPTHIHQIIMNLCTNALYEMRENGGTLEITLDDLLIEEDSSLTAEIPVGEYICLKVADTGPGIDDQVVSKIFDPFFTTKKRGQGTGMGLSVSAGIIQQYGGAITCTTKLGKGTEFNVYLPCC